MLPDGNDPPYPALQAGANPSQLKKHGTGQWIRTTTEQVLNLLPLPIGLHRLGTDSRNRTYTERGLSPLPLPIGLYRRYVWARGPESNWQFWD